MNRWVIAIKKVLGISKTEYRGYSFLVSTIFFCTIVLWLVDTLTYAPYSNYAQDIAKLDSLLLVMDKREPERRFTEPIILLSEFDPNTATTKELISVGFPTWLANRVANYRDAGGSFSKASDLLKIYNFPDSLFTKVESFVRIKPTKNKSKSEDVQQVTSREKLKLIPFPKTKFTKPIFFDLNKADTSILQTVKGVGSVLSKRIIKYRTLLGGFVNTNQLYQIYNLDSGTINNLLVVGIIEPEFNPTKLPINDATKEQLAAHPYISWSSAKLIIAYRNQHGKFDSLSDVAKVYSIDKVWIKKIAPYLTF